ncbi:MAG: hypothetical protein IKP73_17705 [Bacteroidales bacterium]|nr:hypothetical protein [Bacteroidales bacterium]
MKLRVLLAVVATVGAIGVASAQKTTTVEVTATEARSTDAVASVHARPLICDVSMKVYTAGASWCKESEFNTIDKKTSRFTDYWFLTASDVQAISNSSNTINVDEVKRYGQFRSQQYHQCDVIIAPILNFRSASKDEKQLRGADFVVIVSGYAGDFINFKNATEEDLRLIEKNKTLTDYRGGEAIQTTVKGRN